MQSEGDANRMRNMGAAPKQVQVVGNLKYDLAPPKDAAFIRELGDKLDAAAIEQVLIAGSTMEGEEEQVLSAYQRVRERFPRSLLVIAPRHPQRFDAAAGVIASSGLMLVRRSQLADSAVPPGGVLLLDSVGELASAYRLATAAFVGGSLVPHGGHNPLEPAYFGVPVAFGPSMHNFAQMAEQFVRSGAAFPVASAAELAQVWMQLLGDSGLRERSADAATALLQSNRGATDRVLQVICSLLASTPVDSQSGVTAPVTAEVKV
jgi:3-deoxy-D-manno-octulosonic-acid transferase